MIQLLEVGLSNFRYAVIVAEEWQDGIVSLPEIHGFTAHTVGNMVILPAKMSNRLLSVNWRKSY